MPVFEQGYRPYEGPRTGGGPRSWPIAIGCLRTAIRWPFITLLVFGSIPLFFKLFQAYATGVDQGFLSKVVNEWGFGEGFFFEAISREIFFVVLLLVVAGSGQIAEDFRTGALQIYFSKPVTARDYVLGKLGTAVGAALFLTLAPGIILLVAVAAFAPDFSFLTENPWLPLKIVAFSLLVSVVLGSLVLAISSLSTRGRMAGLTFAGAYFFTLVLAKVLPKIFDDKRWEAVHIEKCLDAAGRSLFTDGPVLNVPPELAWGVCGGLTIVCLVVLYVRAAAVEVVS